jgi:transposase
MARRTDLNPTIIANAKKLLEAGNYTTTVSDFLGISRQTWYNWNNVGEQFVTQLENGATEEELTATNQDWKLYVEFFDTVRQSTATAEIKIVDGLVKSKSWQAKAWWLERKFPDRWGMKEREKDDGSTEALDKFLDGVADIVEEDDA